MKINLAFSRLSEVLVAFEQSKGLSKENQDILVKAKKLLEQLKTSPSKANFSNFVKITKQLHSSEIDKITASIQPLFSVVEIPEIFVPSKQEKIAPLNICFYSDVDVPDHNNTFHKRLVSALKQKMVFVTSRSLLQRNDNPGLLTPFERRLLQQKEGWDLFQKGGFVIFIPKQLLPELEGLEKLKALDFKGDGTIKQISIPKAFKKTSGKINFDDFKSLFSDHPRREKMFHIAGHGGPMSVSGLNQQHYKEFLNLLKKQKCLGLSVTACSSGGSSSVLALPDDSKQSIASEDLNTHHPFPIIVRSIGDYSTYSHWTEEDLNGYFDLVYQRGSPRNASFEACYTRS